MSKVWSLLALLVLIEAYVGAHTEIDDSLKELLMRARARGFRPEKQPQENNNQNNPPPSGGESFPGKPNQIGDDSDNETKTIDPERFDNETIATLLDIEGAERQDNQDLNGKGRDNDKNHPAPLGGAGYPGKPHQIGGGSDEETVTTDPELFDDETMAPSLEDESAERQDKPVLNGKLRVLKELRDLLNILRGQ